MSRTVSGLLIANTQLTTLIHAPTEQLTTLRNCNGMTIAARRTNHSIAIPILLTHSVDLQLRLLLCFLFLQHYGDWNALLHATTHPQLAETSLTPAVQLTLPIDRQ